MPALGEIARAYARTVAEAAAETLWPTRCAVCDAPGEVLCAACRRNLPHLDWWRACPCCGAPFGRRQCTECNAVALARGGRDKPPFASCASAVTFDEAAARIVRLYKDHGERRLHLPMAEIMAPIVAPEWREEKPAVVAIPATASALRRRGFDHAALLADQVARLLDLRRVNALERPRSKDQRGLSRQERLGNTAGRFAAACEGPSMPSRILLIDDVCTTGATLFAATDALLAAGARQVRCLTFARVW